MNHITFRSEITFDEPDCRVDGSYLHPDEISHYELEMVVPNGVIQKVIAGSPYVDSYSFFLTSEQVALGSVEIDVLLTVFDKQGTASEPAEYTFALDLDDAQVSEVHNVPLPEGILVVLLLSFSYISKRVLH